MNRNEIDLYVDDLKLFQEIKLERFSAINRKKLRKTDEKPFKIFADLSNAQNNRIRFFL